MENLELVTYCGLYCGLCSTRCRIPRQADALLQTMRKEGWEHWGQEIDNFKPFWVFLNNLSKNKENSYCRGGKCGPPFCTIKKCAREKGIQACPFCTEYPCRRIQGLAKGYVNMIGDGRRMKEIGLEKWVAEQEERAKTGFAYVDIRCEGYSVPDD